MGGGGGAGHGDLGVEWDVEDVVELEGGGDSGLGGGVKGAVAPGTAASFLSLLIFSLYTSFNSDTSFNPSSLAFDSSLSLYLERMRSCELCVARYRTSWTRAQRRWHVRGFARGWRRRCRSVGMRCEAIVG